MDEMAAAARDSKGDDPFIITTNTALGRELIREMVEASQNSWEGLWGGGADLELAKDHFRPRLPGRLRNRNIVKERRLALVLRVGGAVLGGIALIGPMLLMVLKNNLVVRLVTVSGCVFIFGLALALFSRAATPREIMGIVATYAAVLVVFVGTTS